LLRAGTDAVVTDDDGHAVFDGYDDGEFELFLEDHNCGTYYYEDGASITIPLRE
jgi:hypothetical protein